MPQARHLIGDRAKITAIAAGKLRRYANLRWYEHFRHIFISYLPNLLDTFKILLGIIQSWWKILRFKPDVIFIKGGYVGLPVGLAAKLFPYVPIVLHDSDATPGLTNRVLSRSARKIATGMPSEFYNYDPKKTTYVGLPVRNGIVPADLSEKKKLKKKLGFSTKLPLILAIGGGQGARAINQAVVANAENLDALATTILATGDANLEEVKHDIKKLKFTPKNLNVEAFLKDQKGLDVFRAADLIVTRAGATTMAEAATLATPTVIVPSPYLAADHQSKNAAVFVENQAAIMLLEKDLENNQQILFKQVEKILTDQNLAKKMSKNIQKFAKKDAAKLMAQIIIEVGNEKKSK